jgi:DNA-binding transcriptional LysR family regulator
MQRAVNDSLERLRELRRACNLPRPCARWPSRTPGFASFWPILRLTRFTASHPHVDAISATLGGGPERSQIDLVVRLHPAARPPTAAVEEEKPLCSLQPLGCAASQDARGPGASHLLTIDLPQGEPPTMDWEPWLQVIGLDTVRLANTVRFTQYSEAVAAACAGQGVVIGRLPLLAQLMREGKLVAPFRSRAASRRGYFVIVAPHAAGNPDAQDFARWLVVEAEQAQRLPADVAKVPGQKKRRA